MGERGGVPCRHLALQYTVDRRQARPHECRSINIAVQRQKQIIGRVLSTAAAAAEFDHCLSRRYLGAVAMPTGEAAT